MHIALLSLLATMVGASAADEGHHQLRHSHAQDEQPQQQRRSLQVACAARGASCRDCLVVSDTNADAQAIASPCGYAPVVGCLDSCDMIADASCYSSGNFADRSGSEICAVADADEADAALCLTKSDNCATCVDSVLSDGISSCRWFGGYCGSGCGMMGCGRTTCSGEGMNPEDGFVVLAPGPVIISNETDLPGPEVLASPEMGPDLVIIANPTDPVLTNPEMGLGPVIITAEAPPVDDSEVEPLDSPDIANPEMGLGPVIIATENPPPVDDSEAAAVSNESEAPVSASPTIAAVEESPEVAPAETAATTAATAAAAPAASTEAPVTDDGQANQTGAPEAGANDGSQVAAMAEVPVSPETTSDDEEDPMLNNGAASAGWVEKTGVTLVVAVAMVFA